MGPSRFAEYQKLKNSKVFSRSLNGSNASSSGSSGAARKEFGTVVPQTVPQLSFESAEKRPELENIEPRKALTLEAVRENSGGEGGIEAYVGEREVRGW